MPALPHLPADQFTQKCKTSHITPKGFTMPTSLSDVESLFKISGTVAITYIIVMGLTHRAGIKYGAQMAQRQHEREGKPVIRELLRSESPGAIWKDEALIRAGVRVAAGTLGLLIYAGVWLAIHWPSVEQLPGEISNQITSWNQVTGILALIITLHLGRSLKRRLWVIAVPGVACSVLAFSIRVLRVEHALVYQSLIFLCVSMILAYQLGVLDGIRAEDFEQQLPLVEVHTAGGETISGLRMKSVSQAEYRFIGQDGAECLIPSAQVCMIRAVISIKSVEPDDTN
jgi:hypothetical protein